MPGPIRGGSITVEVVQAWSRKHQAVCVELAERATVADAIVAAGLPSHEHAGLAIYGEAATADQMLRDGDRIELLRALKIDPKEARRRRAGK